MTKVTVDRALIEQAVDVINSECGYGGSNSYDPRAIAEALRAALAQPAVEPVPLWDIEDLAHAALQEALSYGFGLDLFVRYFKVAQKASPPPPAEQAPVPLLSDEEIHSADPNPHIMFDTQRIEFARAVEKAHGIGGES